MWHMLSSAAPEPDFITRSGFCCPIITRECILSLLSTEKFATESESICRGMSESGEEVIKCPEQVVGIAPRYTVGIQTSGLSAPLKANAVIENNPKCAFCASERSSSLVDAQCRHCFRLHVPRTSIQVPASPFRLQLYEFLAVTL